MVKHVGAYSVFFCLIAAVAVFSTSSKTQAEETRPLAIVHHRSADNAPEVLYAKTDVRESSVGETDHFRNADLYVVETDKSLAIGGQGEQRTRCAECKVHKANVGKSLKAGRGEAVVSKDGEVKIHKIDKALGAKKTIRTRCAKCQAKKRAASHGLTQLGKNEVIQSVDDKFYRLTFKQHVGGAPGDVRVKGRCAKCPTQFRPTERAAELAPGEALYSIDDKLFVLKIQKIEDKGATARH